MHLSGQPDAADMLQFVSGQQADAPVQSVYDLAGVLLFRLRGVGTQPGYTQDKHSSVSVTEVVWHVNALTFIPLLSIISDVVVKA